MKVNRKERKGEGEGEKEREGEKEEEEGGGYWSSGKLISQLLVINLLQSPMEGEVHLDLL